MLFLRLLGKLLLIAAFLALAYDGARMIATPNEGLPLTSISAYLNTYAPHVRENLERFFLDHGSEGLWKNAVEPMLALPVSLLFVILGALIFLAGYRRPPPEIIGEY
jgi:hypothetical protein